MHESRTVGVSARRGRSAGGTPGVVSTATVVFASAITVLAVCARPGSEGMAGEETGKGTKVSAQGIENSLGMKLALIPSGKFQMGSADGEKAPLYDEGPIHDVEITHPFYLGVYEVTQEEYQKVMGRNPSFFSPAGKGKDEVQDMDTSRFPVENVSWDDAVEFCRKLSARPEEKAAQRVYRLPTEAEWEYACRGGAKEYQLFNLGNSLSSKQANFDGNSPYPFKSAEKGPFLKRTNKVGSYPPNGFELYDMHGNVWEFCADWYDRDYYNTSPQKDPHGPTKRDFRVIRGGGWRDNGSVCRSASRNRESTGRRIDGLGFRVALSPAAE